MLKQKGLGCGAGNYLEANRSVEFRVKILI